MLLGIEAFIRLWGLIILCMLIFPVIFLVGMCLSSLFVRIGLPFLGESLTLKSLALLWEAASLMYNAHEIEGMENVPEDESSLLVYYHGTLPIDIQYVIAKFILYRNRKVTVLTDSFLFRIPVIQSLLRLFGAIPAGKTDDVILINVLLLGLAILTEKSTLIDVMRACCERLNDPKKPQILAIAPGGVREAQFGDSDTYGMLWANRRGYAKLAIKTNSPILLLFTKNCREVARCPKLLYKCSLLRWIYEYTRLPVVPIFGLFPVKLTTYISKPIYPLDYDNDENLLDESVRLQMKQMITQYQSTLPGSVIKALFDRFKFSNC